ncbi:nucleoside diphosphate kinase regulator [Oceanidesulfovibrio indonesiensis]|uniref:Nucleoside diphosphate kinase regulator n=1 Tax=Oceanidesulfovibrio indonesiensis TaxID=54767 RepID=A0A7M3MG76_9BACT|nr:nucleoside diphosphate kinase regulator [Oceanidesulfovibrio indonesiensis]TVM18259.1 nucleoside diphosphate kinase regulator [Oceanidesulfovibrio indonesiensis]
MNTQPAIIITSRDADRLESLLESLSADTLQEIEALEGELDRAVIVEPQEVSPNVVTMNSTVRFALYPAGSEHRRKLVYPGAAGSGEDTVSILAPVGSALLGLAEGDEIQWPNANGGVFRLVVHAVEDQPERSGNYHL